MFPGLPSLKTDEAFLHMLGDAGGLCDCETPLDLPGSLATVAAGWPIFGQLVGHNITADRSPLRDHVDPQTLRNARLPRFDLAGIYGDGPVGHPFLYRRDDHAKLLLAPDDEDVPRNSEGIALIGDPRDDSHMLLTQMHLALLKAHNAFVDETRRGNVEPALVFSRAMREMVWHYQWIILNEFLPVVVGQSVVDSILAEGARWFQPGDNVFIPLEFADAAYRFGHCQIRQRYQLNDASTPLPVFPDLLGFRPVPRKHRIDWTLFFDTGSQSNAQRAKKIDGRLSGSLMHLPAAITGRSESDPYSSLAARDLERGHSLGLPSGEEVARHVGVEPLTADEVGLRRFGWRDETPLWYYVLREAAVKENGDRLGPIGGRIVAEVIIVLLDDDPNSILTAEQDWRPKHSLSQLLTASG
jgi:hypothetical protein